MTASPSVGTPGKTPLTPAEIKDRIWKTLKAKAHRAYSPGDFIPILKLKSPKDPEKEAKNRELILSQLKDLGSERLAVEVADGVFKCRLYFDGDQKFVEHAFIGGTLNVHYRFRSSFFRLNLGVLSAFFYRPEKENIWKARIKDITLGRAYVLSEGLKDGLYNVGTGGGKADGENFLKIEGLYIEKHHLVMDFSGEDVRLEDQETLNGTRVDILTPEGMESYRKGAKTFIDKTDPQDHRNVVRRGRFTFDQHSEMHIDYDTGLFGTVVDSIL